MGEEIMCDGVAGSAPFEFAGERRLHYENANIEDIYKRWDELCPSEQMPALEAMVLGLLAVDPIPRTERELATALRPLRKLHKFSPRKAQLLQAYRMMVRSGTVAGRSAALEEVLTTKASKSMSGVLVVTVLTSPYPSVNGGKPQRFTCKWNCYYCPNEPGQPRSYLRDEPAVLRANQNRFDPVLQFTERCATLAQNGHPVDKVELLVLGGTWASYPLEYRRAFCRDLYYAANTFWERRKRPRATLADEQRLNETAATKIIGLTLETRPDTITKSELELLRSYGCTRVQLGAQHVDRDILDGVNRGHGRAETATALRLLKDACYKVDIHLMPNLPGATPEKDIAMFDDVLSSEDLQADQWKIYPCEVTPWTVIKKWFDEGTYTPYSEADLLRVLVDVKAKVHPWIRLNRVIRDIPSNYILGGVDVPNMREDVLAAMRRAGKRCRCIRCREVGDIGGLNQVPIDSWVDSPNATNSRQQRKLQRTKGPVEAARSALRSRPNREGVLARRSSEQLVTSAELARRTYRASGAVEHFLSFETPDRLTIFAFLRLRLSHNPRAFQSLEGCALVRELHVYGQLVLATTAPKTPDQQRGDLTKDAQQHRGFGRRLMAEAERLASRAGFDAIAVISGVGTRDYYRRLGYELHPDGDYLIKRLPRRRHLLHRPFWLVSALLFALLAVVPLLLHWWPPAR
ncbi:hypothetical protein CTAYLR_003217 [Chrysophaeum taylorii]|uniref:tRNA carboxymethyluridine synthase n=1 Tax=Chrysophaeum taylorii TaxID=2483200 RepID=A0AAD7UCJ7_9STRA|nr:hypothetical protein CTAYLR_003217 [Chrysophaeum taylorii]